MRTVAFDPEARLRLELDRTLPDDGTAHAVEVILHRNTDGSGELVLLDDEGACVGTIDVGARFIAALELEAAREAARRAAA